MSRKSINPLSVVEVVVDAVKAVADLVRAIKTSMHPPPPLSATPPPTARVWRKHHWPIALATTGAVRCDVCRIEWSPEVEHTLCPGPWTQQ